MAAVVGLPPGYFMGVETENSYGCCTLNWSEDEDGRKTYYGYDDANRLTDTWTDIQGSGGTDKLVHYTFDAFGNLRPSASRTMAVTVVSLTPSGAMR